jgi:hypothetical protein
MQSIGWRLGPTDYHGSMLRSIKGAGVLLVGFGLIFLGLFIAHKAGSSVKGPDGESFFA